MNEVNWYRLCTNPNAIHILEQHLDKVNWAWLSENPNAIHLLEQHLDKVDWDQLSVNPNAIHLLEKHPNRVALRWTLTNPNALHLSCDLDYARMEERTKPLKEELQAYFFHPDRLVKMAKQSDVEFRTYLQGI